ncbi:MAG: LptF/LptG family permease [Candidatus Kapaibacteriales bacterium]
MILYRYLTKNFLQVFVSSMISLSIIFIIVNLMENLDDFIDNHANQETIIKYYIYFLPEVVRLVTPISVLVGILFSVGRLSHTNEVTAMKSSGFSLYQLIIPFFLLSSIISFVSLYFNGWIVPRANEKKLLIERRFLNKEIESKSVYNFYFRDTPVRNVSIQFYDPTNYSGRYIFIEEYSNEFTPRVYRRVEAKNFFWDTSKSKWILKNCLIREISHSNFNLIQLDSLVFPLKITHSQLLKLKRKIEEMTFDEVKEYLELLNRGGKNVRKEMIKYYAGYAFPFSSLIVVLFAVPFASVKQRSGIAIQIASAMAFSFLYLFFTEIGQVLVYTTSLHPAFGGWLANILFTTLGIIVFLKTQK